MQGELIVIDLAAHPCLYRVAFVRKETLLPAKAGTPSALFLKLTSNCGDIGVMESRLQAEVLLRVTIPMNATWYYLISSSILTTTLRTFPLPAIGACPSSSG